MKIANYIEGKVEEFRLAGKKPAGLGLSSEVMDALVAELKPLERAKSARLSIDGVEIKPYSIITEFLHLRVFTEVGPHMPEDGVLIYEV